LDLAKLHGFAIPHLPKEFLWDNNWPYEKEFNFKKPYCTDSDGRNRFFPKAPRDIPGRLEAAWNFIEGNGDCQETHIQTDGEPDSPRLFLFCGHRNDYMLSAVPYLASLGQEHAKVVGMHRANLMEQYACGVKDGFLPIGYPVDSEGNPKREKFQLRSTNASSKQRHYKAYLKPNGLEQSLLRLRGYSRAMPNLIRAIQENKLQESPGRSSGFRGAKFKSSAYEDLVAFQSDANDLPMSTKEFVTMLRGMASRLGRPTESWRTICGRMDWPARPSTSYEIAFITTTK